MLKGWETYDVIGEYDLFLGKRVRAILLTDDNKYEMEKIVPALSVRANGNVRVGVITTYETPVYLICVNPGHRSKNKRFIMESKHVFRTDLVGKVLKKTERGKRR